MSSASQSQAALFNSVTIPSSSRAHLQLVWAHGWGQSGEAFRALAEALSPVAASMLLDLPGFGRATLPPQTWGTADYADAAAGWIRQHCNGRIIWVGHSFGGRVGLQLAARHPELVSGLVLIAAAGLQRRRSFSQRLRLSARRTFFRSARTLLREGPVLDRLRQRMGSADYHNAGAMRPILSRVVAEDLSPVAAQVKCPALLVYGREDTETPPEFGTRYHALIPGSELAILDRYGHLNILNEGRHQVALRMRRFLDTHLPQ